MITPENEQVITWDEGKGYSQNIDKNSITIYSGDNIIVFKVVDSDGDNICKVLYMFKADEDEFKKVFYTWIKYIKSQNVKVIWAEQKRGMNDSAFGFLKDMGFSVKEKPNSGYKFSYLCKKCGMEGTKCRCKNISATF